MSTRFGFVCFGIGAIFLGVSSASIPVGAADCPTLFDAHVLYGAGEKPVSVAIGDLDGDGDADLVVANSSDDNVSVLLNNGDGTFAADVLYGVGSGPSSVAIGDLDGDGDADLAVVNGSNVSVLLNYGAGTFANDVLYGVGPFAASVAIGDLDGDGDADLAVATAVSPYDFDGSVSVLLNNGDGTFDEDVSYDVGQLALSVALGDLDGDGDADLVVGNALSSSVSVLLNNGDGTFADDVLYDTGGGPISVAIGDLDGDGDADLAVANGIGVSVHLNNGDGTFVDHVLYGAGDYPWSVAIGDLDGDGDADLAVANLDSDSGSVLLNNGDGTFADDVLNCVGDTPRSVAIGDLDGDGAADLVVANFDSDNVSVLLNLTNGMRDECEPDCNSDGIIDSCDIAQGLSEDCNANGIPDECIELEEDCNENGTPDACDLITPFTSVSEELSPIGGNYPQSYTIPAAPLAIDDVTLSFSAVADLNFETQWIDVDINGTFVGMIFTDNATGCPDTPEVDQLVLSPATYNAAVDGNDAVIGLVPTDEVVNLCFNPPSFIVVSVEYEIEVSADDNGNGIPDECESCEGDANGDGLVDPLDSGFVLARFGCDVGAGDPNCDTADMNGDGLVDPLDVGFVLARFGECL